jgi:serine/threonine-protein kinase
VAPRYDAIATIGRGGMAEVFLAAMFSGGGVIKLAVVKRIWPELASDPDFFAMFADEARLSVRMSHPNVVQTYEVIEEGDRIAIAMEYLEGQPLPRVFNRLRGISPLSLPLRLRIITKVLAGLDYVHELTDYDGAPLSTVHRDVSPQNVFVTYSGNVKLMDFGVAKNVAGAHQTRPGALKGKLSYMAPEQFRGDPVDRRADIFAVGVMLWEMLAGRRIWNGVSDAEIVRRLTADVPLPPLPSGLALPPGLDAICARALERDRERRYTTAAEMEADLERVLTGTIDSYARPLGRAVSEAFAVERAERQALIDRYLRDAQSGRLGDRPPSLSTFHVPESYQQQLTPSGATTPSRSSVIAFVAEADATDPTPLAPGPAPLAEGAAAPAAPPRRRHLTTVAAALGTAAVALAIAFVLPNSRGATPRAAAPPAAAAVAPATPAGATVTARAPATAPALAKAPVAAEQAKAIVVAAQAPADPRAAAPRMIVAPLPFPEPPRAVEPLRGTGAAASAAPSDDRHARRGALPARRTDSPVRADRRAPRRPGDGTRPGPAAPADADEAAFDASLGRQHRQPASRAIDVADPF